MLVKKVPKSFFGGNRKKYAHKIFQLLKKTQSIETIRENKSCFFRKILPHLKKGHLFLSIFENCPTFPTFYFLFSPDLTDPKNTRPIIFCYVIW